MTDPHDMSSVSSLCFVTVLITFFCRVKDGFKINNRHLIKMPKKCEYVRFKSHDRKVKSPSMIYPDFESILVPEDNGKEKDIKNMFLALMVINHYVLMKNLVNILSLS